MTHIHTIQAEQLQSLESRCNRAIALPPGVAHGRQQMLTLAEQYADQITKKWPSLQGKVEKILQGLRNKCDRERCLRAPKPKAAMTLGDLRRLIEGLPDSLILLSDESPLSPALVAKITEIVGLVPQITKHPLGASIRQEQKRHDGPLFTSMGHLEGSIEGKTFADLGL